LHLHVVDPSPGLAERAAALTRTRTCLNVTVEPLPDQPSPAYFASVRFLMARQLLDLYGCDLLISDIDVEFIADPAPQLRGLSAAAFACYAYSGFGPASRYIAYLTHFSHVAGGRDVAEPIARFIRSKLDVPWPFNWMLDQAAVISALRWLRAERTDLIIARLNDVFGRPASTFFRQQEQDEAKQQALDKARIRLFDVGSGIAPVPA
jgi:hypothetical protein